MKKIISFLLSAIMLMANSISVYSDNPRIQTENIVNTIAVTLEQPVPGAKPSVTASTSEGANTHVTAVDWDGEFDENGCFKKGGDYIVAITVSVNEGTDKIIDDWYPQNFTVNGQEALFKYYINSVTTGVLFYRYKDLAMPHQNHCFCGGELTLGEHSEHEQHKYTPWNGKSAVSYKNNTAYVYLTGDVERSETLRIGGDKTLNLCLNGYTIKKSGSGRVINIVSGGKLRLCDCSAMGAGKITGGSHEMGGGIHNGGTFVMYGGKITGNNGMYGGGVWNNYNFYFYGGEITQNRASYGGGLWNANSGDAQLIIFGGSINRNEATYGGGLWNNDNGNLTMKGGEIRENIAGKSGGGVWNHGAHFTLEDGYIYKNFSQIGAGVWTQSLLSMTGGYIVANEARYPNNDKYTGIGGGVWINDDSIFHMSGGEISGNIAGEAAGGVWINDKAQFIMHGGTISGNDALIGGGAYIQRHENGGGPGIFRLSGNSRVYGNRGETAGGGIYVKGVLEISGGEVYGNVSDSEYLDLAIEPSGEVREGTSLPTQFVDVPADAYYLDPVLWAVENNITTGTSDFTFSPDDPCNTAQILTFLWRASGSPEVKIKHLFADVYEDDYFYMAAHWANSLGIVERALYPNFSCTRLSAVYFIWVAAGSPECKTPLTFTDTTDERYTKYHDAIAWAVEQGITTGTSPTTFSPGKTCTRAEILTFLWRAASKGLI